MNTEELKKFIKDNLMIDITERQNDWGRGTTIIVGLRFGDDNATFSEQSFVIPEDRN